MQQHNRRQVIKTTGVGAGVALGAGAASANGTDDASSDQTVARTFTATASEASVALDEDDPQAALNNSNQAEGAVSISGANINFGGEIYEDGTWESTSLNLPDLTEPLKNLDFVAVAENVLGEIDLQGIVDNLSLGGSDTTEDGLIEFLATQVNKIDATTAQVDALATLLEHAIVELAGQEILDIITPKSIINDILADPVTEIENLIDLLPFVIDGVDSIDSVNDILALVFNDPSNFEPELLTRLQNTDVTSLLNSIGIKLNTTGISGDFDASASLVTASLSDLSVEVSYEGTVLINFQPPQQSITLTSATSGALSGSVSGLDTDLATASLVNNELTLGVDQLSIDDELSSTNANDLIANLLAGTNLLPTDVDVNQLVSDADIDKILDQISVDGLINDVLGNRTIINDTSGRHALTFDNAEMDFSGGSGGSPPPIVGSEPPRDTDGDGNYEKVRGGDGEPGIFDVQALFSNLNSPEIQENSEAFNFQDGDPGTVTIFDVQALFNKVTP